jgi:phage tail-like protein
MRAERIARLLPETYRSTVRHGGVLETLLGIMEQMHERSEQVIGELDRYLDPMRAPDAFVPMLAHWVSFSGYLDWSGGRPGAGQPRFAPGLDRLRLLISAAASLNARRGTASALQEFLVTATGAAGFVVEESPPDALGHTRPFHIRIRAPAAARPYSDLLLRIVDRERPAYVTYEIVYDSSAPLESPDDREGDPRV